MKNFAYLLILLLISGCSSGDIPLSKTITEIEDRVRESDRMLTSYTSGSLTLSDGSVMTAYFYNAAVQKLVIEKNITYGLESRKCYIDKWKVYYITDTRTILDPGTGDNAKRDVFYFSGNKLIAWKKSGGILLTSGSEFRSKEKLLLDEVEEYLLLIR